MRNRLGRDASVLIAVAVLATALGTAPPAVARDGVDLRDIQSDVSGHRTDALRGIRGPKTPPKKVDPTCANTTRQGSAKREPRGRDEAVDPCARSTPAEKQPAASP